MNYIFLSGSVCPVLGTPISGRKYGSKYNNGDIVTFECDPGFVLKGSTVRKCLENGTWNGTEAVCRGKCLLVGTFFVSGSLVEKRISKRKHKPRKMSRFFTSYTLETNVRVFPSLHQSAPQIGWKCLRSLNTFKRGYSSPTKNTFSCR